MRKLSAFWMAALVGGFAVYGLAAPTWWSHRGVLDADPASDYSGVNAGQLKHVARMAYDELQTNLPGGAGATVSNLVFGFQNSNNYVAINLGQLKNVAAPFYSRLIAEGVVTGYPWTSSTADDASYTMVNLGQLKTVFGFELDPDADSLGWAGELLYGTGQYNPDTDGDGVDDGFEVYYGMNPTNTLGSSGVNSNWMFHSQSEYARATWELVPGLWQRFLMVDYQAGTNTAYFMAPQRLGLDATCTTQIQVRSSWYNGASWTDAYYSGTFFTNTVISADRPFRGLPTLGQVTLSVYRIQWPIPSIAQTNQTTAYYAPLVKILTNSVQSGYAWVLDRLSTSGAGYGYNNYLISPQATGPQYGGSDYNADLDKIRFRNGSFESGATLSHTNEPFWGGYGLDGTISTSIVHGGTRSFLARDLDGMYQQIVVHAGEELVLGGWMYAPSPTNALDTNSLSGDRYGQIVLEYYDQDGGDAMAINGMAITATNTKDTWTYSSVTSLVPARAVYAHVSLRTVAPTVNLNPPGHVYFDDISVMVQLDTDQDGLPDRWEALWPGALSTNQPGDAIQDNDGDGLLNIEEYRIGTSPSADDSDADGMPDGWEYRTGMQPLNVADAQWDTDRDGFKNIDEYEYGTDPLRADTDGDGLDDATEALDLLSNPLGQDFTGFVTAQELAGTSTASRVGSWYEDGTSLCADGLRGSLDYDVTVTTNDIYRLAVEATDCDSWNVGRAYEIRLSVNGLFLGRQSLVTSTTNGSGVTGAFTPWLTNGTYTVRVEWDNASASKHLKVSKIRLLQMPGPDVNADGRKDWLDRRLARLSGLNSLSTTSAVSPACIEGRDPYIAVMAISGGVTSAPAINGRWYANVPLNPTGSLNRVFSFQSAGLVVTAQLTWSATELIPSPAATTIRLGDALRFAARTAGANSGTSSVSVAGVTSYVFSATQSVVHAFASTGSYVVTGTYCPISGGTQFGCTTVTVVSAHFDGSPACWVGVTRRWTCTNLSSSATSETDPEATVTDVAGMTGRVFDVRVETPETHGIIARVGEKGLIADHVLARGFRFASGDDTGITSLGKCGTGVSLFENPFVLSPLLDDLTLQGNVIISGVLYGDGTWSQSWTHADFDASGVMPVRFLRAAQVNGAFCNNVDIYQGTNLVGRHSSP